MTKLEVPARNRRGSVPYRFFARGFTLVEVVVALSVMSLLMVATLAALRTFGNTQASVDKVIGRVDEIRAVSSFLRDTLQASVPIRGEGSDSGVGFGSTRGYQETSFFKGGRDSFQFKARLVLGEDYGGTFLLRVVRDGDVLLLQWQKPPEPINKATWGGAANRVLVEQLQELQISYRGARDKKWVEKWDEPVSPVALRLNIKANDRYWPELIMAVQR